MVEDESVAPFLETKQQLAAYFAGILTEFNLPLQLRGTIFQQQIWEVLKTISQASTLIPAILNFNSWNSFHVKVLGFLP